MNFCEHQNLFIEIANNLLKTQQNRLEKIKALCEFVNIEEGLSPDDTAVSERILRQLVWLANQCIENFMLTCKELEPDSSIFFGICELELEDAKNGLIGIYAYTQVDSEQTPTFPNMEKLPKEVNSHQRMVLILDIYSGASNIPWKT